MNFWPALSDRPADGRRRQEPPPPLVQSTSTLFGILPPIHQADHHHADGEGKLR
jgi:hypothetical protein